MTGRPLPSSGSLGSVPLIPRYYGSLRLPAALPLRLRLLRLQVPPGIRFFAPLPEWMLSNKGQDFFFRGILNPLSPVADTAGSPRFLVDPITCMPCSLTPAGSGTTLLCTLMLPSACFTASAPAMGHFGALSHGLQTPLCTLRRMGYPITTQHSVPVASTLTGWD